MENLPKLVKHQNTCSSGPFATDGEMDIILSTISIKISGQDVTFAPDSLHYIYNGNITDGVVNWLGCQRDQ